jgi:hypothetical protein
MLISKKGNSEKFWPIVAIIPLRPQNLHALRQDTESAEKIIRFSNNVVHDHGV